jgi:uncharacterized protein YqiB (DUF1249 family)
MNAAKQANTIGAQIFHRLLDVVPDLMTLSAGNYGRSEVSGFMNLNLDVLAKGPNKVVIALSHLYKHPSGDMIPDPDMQITVFLSDEYAEAQTFQDFYGFRAVETNVGRVDQRVQRELNSFLLTWLGNLIAQGHTVKLRQESGLLGSDGRCNGAIQPLV